MRRIKSFYDLIAAFALVFDVDWDSDYPPDDAGDYFWDDAPAVTEPVESVPPLFGKNAV